MDQGKEQAGEQAAVRTLSQAALGEKAALANQVLYTIANAVNVTPDLDKLYQVIHRTLSCIIDVTNFFIAIVDEEGKTLHFPYYVDTEDDDFTPITDFDTSSSLTGLVVLERKPVLLASRELEQRAEKEGIWGPVPRIWMGVPLIVRDRVIGVVAVQSYVDESLYSEADLELLAAVSDQIALAIDRRRSLDELQRSENRYRQLFEHSNDAIILHDRDGRILDCNGRAAELTGYSRNRLLGMDVKELHFPEDLEDSRRALEKAIAEGHIRFETVFRRAEGQAVDVEISARVVEYRKKGLVQALIRDIRSRKQAERRLLENEEKYRSLFYNAQVGLFRTSPRKDRLLECNDALVNMAGYDDRDDFLANFSIFDSYEDERDREWLIDLLRSRGSINNVEMKLRGKGGRPGWYRITASYYPEFDWIEGVVVDITAERKARKEREELRKRLERSERMEALGMLAGGVAHDLNNILAGIISYPELLLLKYGDQPELRKPLESILEAGERAAMIVEDMLTIARGAASSMVVHDMHCLVDEYLESPECRKLSEVYPELHLVFQPKASQSLVRCSPVHVKKCLMNLVTNGVEAMGGKGTLTITSGNEFGGGVAFPQGQDGLMGWEKMTSGGEAGKSYETLILRVVDTGEGISQSELDHIFEPFYSKKMLGRSGTGLGLTVVWNTMRNHGGTVEVESSENGTVFTLVFPLSREEASASERKHRSSALIRGRGESVLVVDDEPELRKIASEILRELGYRVVLAASGEEALACLKTGRVDLVVLDMLMEPGMNGAETYRRICEIVPGQRAVIASGFAENEDVRGALRAGVRGYIRKPYTMEKLSRTVRAALDAP